MSAVKCEDVGALQPGLGGAAGLSKLTNGCPSARLHGIPAIQVHRTGQYRPSSSHCDLRPKHASSTHWSASRPAAAGQQQQHSLPKEHPRPGRLPRGGGSQSPPRLTLQSTQCTAAPCRARAPPSAAAAPSNSSAAAPDSLWASPPPQHARARLLLLLPSHPAPTHAAQNPKHCCHRGLWRPAHPRGPHRPCYQRLWLVAAAAAPQRRQCCCLLLPKPAQNHRLPRHHRRHRRSQHAPRWPCHHHRQQQRQPWPLQSCRCRASTWLPAAAVDGPAGCGRLLARRQPGYWPGGVWWENSSPRPRAAARPRRTCRPAGRAGRQGGQACENGRQAAGQAGGQAGHPPG